MRRPSHATGSWTRLQALDYRVRVCAHSVVRLGRWAAQRRLFARPAKDVRADFSTVLAATCIGSRACSFGARLEAGRWKNLRLVAAAIDGSVASVRRPFSFWRAVGRTTAARGYAEGAHFEGGCVVPSIGGGICALGDALFEVALRADCTILERHGHTLLVPRRQPMGPDATLLWPYVDLRFAPRRGSVLVTCEVEPGGIAVTMRGTHASVGEIELRREPLQSDSGIVRTRLVRARRIERRVPSKQNEHHEQRELIAIDRKQVIADPLRNCDTCSEASCARRKRRAGG